MVIRKPGEIYDLVQTLVLLAVTQPKLLCIAYIISPFIMHYNWKKTSKQAQAFAVTRRDKKR